MAKTNTTRVRRKIRKSVSDGVAHVHASFNNTIITITDVKATRCLGQLLAVLVLKGRVKVLLLQRN